MPVITSARIATGTCIAWKNLLTEIGAVVTANSEQVEYPVQNIYDWNQYDWWKPFSFGSNWVRVELLSAKTASYCALFGHNLSDVSAVVQFQYSVDGGVSWTTVATSAPADGNTILVTFDPVTASNWRILVTTTSLIPSIAGWMIGERTEFDKGLGPGLEIPALSPTVQSKTAKSELGVNIGTSIKSVGVKGTINLTNIDPTWIRSEFAPLVQHLNHGRPCVFSWDYIGHPNESILIWKSDDIPAPSYSGPILMQATLPFEGIL